MNSLDARVRYTRMVIAQSFRKLLQEKPMAKITVTEICTLAQINRATFYKHYMDVPDLMEKIQNEMFQQFRQQIFNNVTSMETYLTELLRFIQKEKENFWILGSENGDPNLLNKTLQFSFESTISILKGKMAHVDGETQKMLVRFLTHGNAGILSGWIRDGMKLEPEAVVAAMMSLCAAVVNTI